MMNKKPTKKTTKKPSNKKRESIESERDLKRSIEVIRLFSALQQEKCA